MLYLQDGARLVSLDPLGHHVQDVVHHRRSELEVEVRLHPLLGHRLGDALRVSDRKKPKTGGRRRVGGGGKG